MISYYPSQNRLQSNRVKVVFKKMRLSHTTRDTKSILFQHKRQLVVSIKPTTHRTGSLLTICSRQKNRPQRCRSRQATTKSEQVARGHLKRRVSFSEVLTDLVGICVPSRKFSYREEINESSAIFLSVFLNARKIVKKNGQKKKSIECDNLCSQA